MTTKRVVILWQIKTAREDDDYPTIQIIIIIIIILLLLLLLTFELGIGSIKTEFHDILYVCLFFDS